MEQDQVKENIKNQDSWVRGGFILLFLFVGGLVETIVMAMAFFQFIHLLFTRRLNEQMTKFGGNVSLYGYHVMRYVTGVDDDKPWPFREWPDETTLPGA